MNRNVGPAELDRTTPQDGAGCGARDYPAVFEHLAEDGGRRPRSLDTPSEPANGHRLTVSLLEQGQDPQGSNTAGAGVRSTLPSSDGRDSVEVNGVHRVHEFVSIKQAGRVGSEQFGDEPVFGRVEGGGVGTDENVRLGPQRTAFG